MVSLALGMVVAFWLSALAFGDNNNLINGWAGLIASIMMLYVSYWLHRNSDITRWNNYMEGKSNQALSNGKMISLPFSVFSDFEGRFRNSCLLNWYGWADVEF